MHKKKKVLRVCYRSWITLFAGLVLMAAFVPGCDDSEVETLEGTFLDSRVEGIEYKASLNSTISLAGVTDAKGKFKYPKGATIIFSIGDIVIGKTLAKPVITPVDLVEGAADENHPVVINIIRFLQTLDDDGNPENGIMIIEPVRTRAVSLSINFDVSISEFEQDAAVLQMNDMITAEPIRIRVNMDQLIRNILIFCIGCEIGFVLMDIIFNFLEFSEYKTIRRFWNIAREESLASWFGTTQTFMAGLTLWLIFFINKHTETSWKTVFGWFVLAMFFTYMAIDDGAEIHERLGTVFELMSEKNEGTKALSSWAARLLAFFPSYPWQLLFLPFFGIVGVFMFFFLWARLDVKTARLMILLALACFVAAVCLDFIEGLDKNHQWNIHTMIREKYDLEKYTVRHFSKSLEEFLEMLGITLFWTSFIQFFKLLPKTGVRFFTVSDGPA